MAVGAAGHRHHRRGASSLSVLALTQTGIALPLVLTAVYAFLSIRHSTDQHIGFPQICRRVPDYKAAIL